MRCETHVRFLGGGGAAMRCRYPTAVCLGSLNKRIDDRTRVRSGRRVAKQPSLAANHEGPDRILALVVVDWQIAALRVANKPTPVIPHIGQRATQRTLFGGTRGSSFPIQSCSSFSTGLLFSWRAA